MNIMNKIIVKLCKIKHKKFMKNNNSSQLSIKIFKIKMKIKQFYKERKLIIT